MKTYFKFPVALLLFIAFQAFQLSFGQSNVLTPDELLGLESASVQQLSPDGETLIYSIITPRGPNEEAGPAERKYFKMNLSNHESTPLFDDDVKGSSPRYSPDGAYIAFLYKKDEDQKQVWAFPAEGGDMIQITHADNHVNYYRWHPDGNGIAYLSMEPKTERERELAERGYDFIFYEENLKSNRLFNLTFREDFETAEKQELLEGSHVWDFEFSPDGKWIALSTSEKNLIDYRYMFRELKILDVATAKVVKEVGNEGKLGNYVFNEDGTHLAFTSALDIKDHAVSQVFTYALEDEILQNHTPEDIKAHISWVSWKNNKEVLSYTEEGVYPKLMTISIKNDKHKTILDSENTGIIFHTPVFTDNFKQFAFTGETPYDPSNIYTWDGKGELKKVSQLNPQLKSRKLGEQEVIRFTARDGKEIEGLLIKPVGYERNKKYPLIMYVHGGPEAHYNNGWLSRYSRPGQVMAGKGYLAAYINYRASTGYGVDFGMEGYEDPAGKEFDDLADGIEYLVAEKGADEDRVGMAGGSYGGYASAWFATYYTDYVDAVCMFVGISNLISKRGTTDIPYEELLVHSGKPLEEQWQMNLERSPIYWAHQSETATLIIGGADDPRVHPSQSLELYRRMKMNDHPAVRLVQYPGEGHGNRKQVGQIDVLYRQMNWFDWYVKEAKPLDGPMPPLDISDEYGLDWEF